MTKKTKGSSSSKARRSGRRETSTVRRTSSKSPRTTKGTAPKRRRADWTRDYARLIVEHGIRPIVSENQYRKSLREIDKMMKLRATDRATCTAIDVFAKLIEDYESKAHPTPKVSPDRMLAHLIDIRQTSQAQVAKSTGIPRSTISAVLAGRRHLSLDAIKKVSKHFRVPADAFIS